MEGRKSSVFSQGAAPENTTNEKPAHRQLRSIHKLKNGNILGCHEGDGTVREVTPEGVVVWEYSPVDSVFDAIRLGNGNTLIAAGKGYFSVWDKLSNGIFYNASETTFADITDGATNTYLAGEKYVFPENTPTDWGESWNMYVGYDDDNCRWVGNIDDVPVSDFVPRPELYGYYMLRWHMFGSAHDSGCNFAMCDGSVRLISFAIDAEVHRRLGNRMDGLPIDPNKF